MPACGHRNGQTPVRTPRTAGACCWSRPSASSGAGTSPAHTSAHGSVLVDVDGDERIDLLYNHTALIHGHGYQPVTEAVTRQSRQLEAMPFPNEHETAASDNLSRQTARYVARIDARVAAGA